MNIAPTVVRGSASIEETIERIDRYGLLRQQLASKRALLESEGARERFHHQLATFAEPVSFANVLLLAAALHLCFRRNHRFLEDAAFSMHVVSFVLLSSLTLVLALKVRYWLGSFIFVVLVLVGLWHFAYLAVAIRRFYLTAGRWSGWVLSVAAAFLLYVLNTVFMTGVQIAGAAIALASF
jgi:hypothetical protein